MKYQIKILLNYYLTLYSFNIAFHLSHRNILYIEPLKNVYMWNQRKETFGTAAHAASHWTHSEKNAIYTCLHTWSYKGSGLSKILNLTVAKTVTVSLIWICDLLMTFLGNPVKESFGIKFKDYTKFTFLGTINDGGCNSNEKKCQCFLLDFLMQCTKYFGKCSHFLFDL